MWPLTSQKLRDDAFEPSTIIFRLVSISFIGYCVLMFFQDERALEDLKEFTTKGMADLLDYGKEWDIGKSKLGNGTDTSFRDKINKKMKEDVSDDL